MAGEARREGGIARLRKGLLKILLSGAPIW
jgi:hypothetical protein